jgi:hypothetical protein
MHAEETTFEKRKVRIVFALAGLAVLVAVGWYAARSYVESRSLVFNESFFGHAHCITQAGLALRIHANANAGQFPFHTNGFGDALLPLIASAGAYPFTGPMFDSSELMAAQAARRDVDESRLGRIYVQGLSETNNPAIALLFDQWATPGGDHCHGLARLSAPLGREVLWLDGSHEFVKESEWHGFATNQIVLLEAEGIDRRTAQVYYEMTGLKFED